MNDRELLELAAKAAGFEKIDYSNFAGMDVRYGFSEAIWNGDSYWNPLMDDGDSLKLAVKLGMEVYIDNHPDGCHCTEAQSHTYSTPDNAMRSIVNHEDDQFAATRLAIVIVAAEIGKAMP